MPTPTTRLHVEFDLDIAAPPSNKIIRSALVHDFSSSLSFFLDRYAKARNVKIHRPVDTAKECADKTTH